LLKSSSVSLSLWSGLNFLLAFLILTNVAMLKANSPLWVLVFESTSLETWGAAMLNTLTIPYPSSALVLAWVLLVVSGLVEVTTFIAAGPGGSPRWPAQSLTTRKVPMQAIVLTKYGSPDVLQLQEVAQPAPQPAEVLIKIQAASVNARDWRFMRAQPFFIRLAPGGFWRPKNKLLGADVAGRVEAVGGRVTQFRPGDEVFGYLPSALSRGTLAEYVCAPETYLALKPANISFEQAAAVPLAAVTALQGLRDKGRLQPGQSVVIQGASGGVGLFAVQLAKALGGEVTAVCSPRHLELVRALGADHVVDYTQEDFTKNGPRYDLILAVNGYHPLSDYRRALKPEGAYVMVGGALRQLFQAASHRPNPAQPGGQKILTLSLTHNPQDLVFLRELLESGRLVPVIDGCYPLNKTREAFWYFEQAHPQGKVVIQVA
jgi:NADPH:quinone reductase-like Zn-dependent oxidoreductase